MISKKDAQDTLMDGLALAQQAYNEFLLDWNLPSLISGMRPLWMQLTPAQKEQLKAANPELYDRISSLFAVK